MVVMLDGGLLLVNLLYKQRKYAEARAAAEEQVAYEEPRTASFGSTGNGGDPDGGIYQTALDYAANIAYRQGCTQNMGS